MSLDVCCDLAAWDEEEEEEEDEEGESCLGLLLLLLLLLLLGAFGFPPFPEPRSVGAPGAFFVTPPPPDFEDDPPDECVAPVCGRAPDPPLLAAFERPDPTAFVAPFAFA